MTSRIGDFAIRRGLPGLLAAGGIALVWFWVQEFMTYTVLPREPGADRPVAVGTVEVGRSADWLTEPLLESFAAAPQDRKGDWPCFRGPNYNGVSPEDVKLLRQLPAGGLKKLWQLNLGEGYAGPAVWKGMVYVLDYDAARQADAVRCFRLSDGQEIWRYSYPVRVKRNHGMSRTVPAVADGFVVSIGPKCNVSCLDAMTGKVLWTMDLAGRYGTEVPLWYAGQCPRIEDGRAILAPGGSALMAAVDCATGKVVWESGNPGGWKMTHSSILPITFANRRMYVYCGSGGVAGADAQTGKILWSSDEWKLRTNIPAPVDLGQGRLFFSAGYNKGSMLMKLTEERGEIIPNVEWTVGPEVFGSDQQTPIFYKGYLYGVRPDCQLVCMDTGGKIIWASGGANKYGLGAYMIADDMFFVLNDDGELSCIKAGPERFELVWREKSLPGRESWGPPALTEGKLIVRDLTTMVCLDVSADGSLVE